MIDSMDPHFGIAIAVAGHPLQASFKSSMWQKLFFSDQHISCPTPRGPSSCFQAARRGDGSSEGVGGRAGVQLSAVNRCSALSHAHQEGSRPHPWTARQ